MDLMKHVNPRLFALFVFLLHLVGTLSYDNEDCENQKGVGVTLLGLRMFLKKLGLTSTKKYPIDIQQIELMAKICVPSTTMRAHVVNENCKQKCIELNRFGYVLGPCIDITGGSCDNATSHPQCICEKQTYNKQGKEVGGEKHLPLVEMAKYMAAKRRAETNAMYALTS